MTGDDSVRGDGDTRRLSVRCSTVRDRAAIPVVCLLPLLDVPQASRLALRHGRRRRGRALRLAHGRGRHRPLPVLSGVRETVLPALRLEGSGRLTATRRHGRSGRYARGRLRYAAARAHLRRLEIASDGAPGFVAEVRRVPARRKPTDHRAAAAEADAGRRRRQLSLRHRGLRNRRRSPPGGPLPLLAVPAQSRSAALDDALRSAG